MPQHADRTDTVQEKLRLIEAALIAKRHDLALSLAESVKDTLTWLRQTAGDPPPLDIDAGSAGSVSDLPAAWARWARGWSRQQSVALFEGVGIARSREPVSIRVGFPESPAPPEPLVSDLRREVRVARVEDDGALREVVSQIHGERLDGDVRTATLVFPADVPAHGSARYVIFFANPFAELPEYTTDLRVSGEGYGLDVSNEHYTARLSRQMGQLERLTSKRQHGLELYAGGKGHGEPPTIDWAHDYVDEGGFQKLRVKDWARPPNHEVVRGPLTVSVRRWGFPHSPVHPVFTPSRLHVDVTYTFHAGLPYFFKESRMEAVKDLKVEAVRDDEWVFSGYSFTDRLWIDRRGKLREGAVPPEDAENLWGVGFYHRESRDVFVALWLEHRVEGHGDIQHGGAPTLHYPGHGQLWSRYPVNRASLAKGAVFVQKNAYLVGEYPREGAAAMVEGLRHQLLHPLEASAEAPAPPGRPAATGSLARRGETEDTAPLKRAIWEKLREVRDEQLYRVNASVVDLGLVHDVRVRGPSVEVVVATPHAGRPVVEFYVDQGGGRVDAGIRERLLGIDGVDVVVVTPAADPVELASRLGPAGRRALGL